MNSDHPPGGNRGFPDRPFILVTNDAAKPEEFRILGWIYAREAPELGELNGKGWMVPKNKLRAPAELNAHEAKTHPTH